MYTIIETPAFQDDARQIWSEQERGAFCAWLAANPEAGDELQGTGGCRKIRVAGKGRGKSGGYRIITFFTGLDLPIFLLAVFSKGEKANLNQVERNGLAKLTSVLVSEYKSKPNWRKEPKP